MKRKLLILGISAMLGVLSCFNSLAALELQETSAAYLMNGEWRTVNTAGYSQAGLSDGWHEENGNTFYFINGRAVTLSIKPDNKWYLFDECGVLLKESSQEYFKMIELLSQMHEAKAKDDTMWEYAFDSMTEYQKYIILDAYCKRYMFDSTDVGNAGFKFVDNKIMIDMENPRYETERKAEEFLRSLLFMII